MDIRKLQRVIVDALEDVKAQDIKVFNTTHLTELFDRTVIASNCSTARPRRWPPRCVTPSRKPAAT